MKEKIYYFGTSLTEHGHYVWDVEESFLVSRSLNLKQFPFNVEGFEQRSKKGEVDFYHIEEYSICRIEGSCRDNRQGTESVFIIKGNVADIDLMKLILSTPVLRKIIIAMPFDVNWPLYTPQSEAIEGKELPNNEEIIKRIDEYVIRGFDEKFRQSHKDSMIDAVNILLYKLDRAIEYQKEPIKQPEPEGANKLHQDAKEYVKTHSDIFKTNNDKQLGQWAFYDGENNKLSKIKKVVEGIRDSFQADRSKTYGHSRYSNYINDTLVLEFNKLLKEI